MSIALTLCCPSSLALIMRIKISCSLLWIPFLHGVLVFLALHLRHSPFLKGLTLSPHSCGLSADSSLILACTGNFFLRVTIVMILLFRDFFIIKRLLLLHSLLITLWNLTEIVYFVIEIKESSVHLFPEFLLLLLRFILDSLDHGNFSFISLRTILPLQVI